MKQMVALPDDKLVALYAEGDNKAFDVLLSRHQNRVFTYILRIVKDEDVANDIFQDTFVKAVMTIKQGRYAETGKFSAWISRIAHNLIIDFYRQEKSENLCSCDNEELNILNRKDLSESTVEDAMVVDQIHTDVKRLIDALPDLQREVLIMRYYKDMSFKEIAEATNVSINTALGRMRYAILNMRRLAEENKIALTA
ncbi:MAG: sigma-70 family RNA polymerase sigma factor [Muribaculaceae bacterium]|nr:sigma-70 family RNA polymerase sigma factor [Muribaculaceae bacterium]